MMRIGAGSVVDRIKRLYADKLEKSPEAKAALIAKYRSAA